MEGYICLCEELSTGVLSLMPASGTIAEHIEYMNSGEGGEHRLILAKKVMDHQSRCLIADDLIKDLISPDERGSCFSSMVSVCKQLFSLMEGELIDPGAEELEPRGLPPMTEAMIERAGPPPSM